MEADSINSLPELLPVVDFDGNDFLIDIGRREFRRVDEPESRISFYSERGRRMITAMKGMQWRRYGLNNLQQASCSECGC